MLAWKRKFMCARDGAACRYCYRFHIPVVPGNKAELHYQCYQADDAPCHSFFRCKIPYSGLHRKKDLKYSRVWLNRKQTFSNLFGKWVDQKYLFSTILSFSIINTSKSERLWSGKLQHLATGCLRVCQFGLSICDSWMGYRGRTSFVSPTNCMWHPERLLSVMCIKWFSLCSVGQASPGNCF